MSKKYPGAKLKESPLGKNWHHVETAGLGTAGTVEVVTRRNGCRR